jgi:hypothetical protein
MRRIDRRWRNIIILTLLVYLLYNYFPSPPKWENNRSANRPPPVHEQSTKPNFLYTSRFRSDPDSDFENQLEQALLEIENRALPDAKGPTKNIWQTGPDDAGERDQDCKLWEEHNQDWEYTVRPQIRPSPLRGVISLQY